MNPYHHDRDGNSTQRRQLGNRYADDNSGNHIDRLREQAAKPVVTPPNHNTRFCEVGQHRVRNDGTKTVKGWACAECRAKR